MNLDTIKKLNIPKLPGTYQFKDKKGTIIYIGKAAELRSRVLSYWRDSAGHSPAKFAMMKLIASVEWTTTESEIEALLLEANMIKRFQPQFNILMRDDKRYAYIKITLEDEIPGVFILRKIDRAGRYFGPFTSSLAARETIKAIRKIWPYCTTRRAQKKPCFYHQIGRCLGICGGVVSKKEYLEKVIKPITLFLEGKKKQIVKNYEARIRKLESSIKYNVLSIVEKHKNTQYIIHDTKYKNIEEELNRLKYQLNNLNNVLAHTNIISVTEKYHTDVVELAKIMGLPKVPQRIEGYDISNIFGKDAVGSMAVFSGGEPDKNEYRKFKIRADSASAKATAEKHGDVQMLKEVLERRFKRSAMPEPQNKGTISPHEIITKSDSIASLQNDRWALPDLLIIDGGKGQLNAALTVLKKFKLEIPILAISKGDGLRSSLAPDKIFFPGQKVALTLPLASPALHFIKRVRDEAHRFAIGYHKKLRKKAFFE